MNLAHNVLNDYVGYRVNVVLENTLPLYVIIDTEWIACV